MIIEIPKRFVDLTPGELESILRHVSQGYGFNIDESQIPILARQAEESKATKEFSYRVNGSEIVITDYSFRKKRSTRLWAYKHPEIRNYEERTRQVVAQLSRELGAKIVHE